MGKDKKAQEALRKVGPVQQLDMEEMYRLRDRFWKAEREKAEIRREFERKLTALREKS